MKKIFVFLSLTACLFPLAAIGDGGFFPPPDYYMYETDQRAVIFYENNLETLVVSVTFRGSAKDFGWVVPTPSYPQTSRGSDEIFTSLEELTRLEREITKFPLSIDENFSLGQKSNQVYVIETKKIDYYDISVLSADDAEALAKWLAKNGYNFPVQSSYILDSYVKNRWYFVAVKIDTSAISSSVSGQLREGHLVPLKLQFNTDKIVFPLKISSVMQNYSGQPYLPARQGIQEYGVSYPNPTSSVYPYPYYYPQQVGLLLYVLTPANKQSLPGFTTQYAGWVRKDTIKNLAFDETGNPWMSPSADKYFLTKLTRWMSYSEMTDDLYFRNAENNDLVNARPLVEEQSNFWFWFFIGASAAFILVIGGAFIYLSKK